MGVATRSVAGRLATAVLSSNRPTLLIGQHLTGWKGLAVPCEDTDSGPFYEPRVTRGDVVSLSLSPRSGICFRGGLQTANCGLRY